MTILIYFIIIISDLIDQIFPIKIGMSNNNQTNSINLT